MERGQQDSENFSTYMFNTTARVTRSHALPFLWPRMFHMGRERDAIQSAARPRLGRFAALPPRHRSRQPPASLARDHHHLAHFSSLARAISPVLAPVEAARGRAKHCAGV